MKNLLNGNAGMVIGEHNTGTETWPGWVNRATLVDIVGEELIMLEPQEIEVWRYNNYGSDLREWITAFVRPDQVPVLGAMIQWEEDLSWFGSEYRELPRPTHSHDSQKIWCF